MGCRDGTDGLILAGRIDNNAKIAMKIINSFAPVKKSD